MLLQDRTATADTTQRGRQDPEARLDGRRMGGAAAEHRCRVITASIDPPAVDGLRRAG